MEKFSQLRLRQQKIMKQRINRMVLILPLNKQSIVTFTDDNYCSYYEQRSYPFHQKSNQFNNQPNQFNNQLNQFNNQLNQSQYELLTEIKLTGRIYEAVVLNEQQILVTLVETYRLFLINVKKKCLKQIYSFVSHQAIHPTREISKFYQSRLKLFKQSNHFYLKQQIVDERKIKIIHFLNKSSIQHHQATQTNQHHKLNKNQSKNTNRIQPNNLFEKETINLFENEPNHEQGFSSDNACRYQQKVNQFPLKQHIYIQLDQKSKLAKFNQNCQQNGNFTFQQIDILTDQKKTIRIQHSAFMLFATITDIKILASSSQLTTQSFYLISVNGKQQKNSIIIMSQNSIKILYESKHIIREFIWLNRIHNFALIAFFFNQKSNDSKREKLKLVNLQNGKQIDEIDLIIDKHSCSFNEDYLFEFKREKISTSIFTFRSLRLVNKQSHYLKMLQNLNLQTKYGQEITYKTLNILDH